MALIVVKVNGRDFPLSCEDGQEPRIRRLAQYVDAKVAEYVKIVGQVGEARLMLLAAITIADELSDANEAAQAARNRPAPTAGESAAVATGHPRHRPAHRVHCGAARIVLARGWVGLRGALGLIMPWGRYLPHGGCLCRSRGFGTWLPPALAGHEGVAGRRPRRFHPTSRAR